MVIVLGHKFGYFIAHPVVTRATRAFDEAWYKFDVSKLTMYPTFRHTNCE